MKNLKKLMVLATVIGVVGVTGAAYAVTVKTPAEITAGLTGKTVQELHQERSTGKTYGTIAREAGKSEDFKAQMLEQKEAILDQRVKDGKLTQEQADAIYNSIKNNQASCDGSGSDGIGKKYGVGFGQGNGIGMGNGMGKGLGNGRALNK